ncbi:hypothetical protein DACRYDRAFT_106371 [Dacryopinax primogenitus]|uniref:Uncharacterized protein n=1 Tax=Dacryopinax primogenitus (strain DJM 731) TaxID=1858805 RepID=M5FYU4_DACPD|nr:uncharacterized protein DACRYDRAFT_106371 [Dacryopinax primogenitus]EJU03201.1 hypothetical protein DACRYDRAFT_106371 [Dacryopinax primogenitus]
MPSIINTSRPLFAGAAQNAAPYSRSTTPSGSSHYKTPAETAENGDDDDIPLADRIPTALAAQKSIRVSARSSARRPPKLKSSVVALPSQIEVEGGKPPPSPGLPAEELMQKLMDLQVQHSLPASKNDASPPVKRLTAREPAGSAYTSIVLRPVATTIPSREQSRPAVLQRSEDKRKGPITSPTISEFQSSIAPGSRHAVMTQGAPAPIVALPRSSEMPSRVVSRNGTMRQQQSRPSDEAQITQSESRADSDTNTRSLSRSNTKKSHIDPQSKSCAFSSAGFSDNHVAGPPQAYFGPPQLDILFTVDVHVLNLRTVVKIDVDASTTAKSALDIVMKQSRATTRDIPAQQDVTLWELVNDFGMGESLPVFCRIGPETMAQNDLYENSSISGRCVRHGTCNDL